MAMHLQKQAEAGRGEDHRRRPEVVHDLPAVPARGRRRQPRAAARGRAAAPGARQVRDHQRPHRRRSTTPHASRTSRRSKGRPGSWRTTPWSSAPARSRARCRSPGCAEQGIGFKSVAEAIYLRNHVLERMDAASSSTDPRAAAAGAHLRLRRRWLRRHRGDGRARGHGPRRLQVLPQPRATTRCAGCWSRRAAGSCRRCRLRWASTPRCSSPSAASRSGATPG